MICIAATCIALSAVSITDGDTFRIGDTRYRLWGIDAPEARDPGGAAATRHLGAIMRGRIACEVMDVDRYSRPVVRCEAGGADLACKMVAAGHARDWPRYSGGYYRSC